MIIRFKKTGQRCFSLSPIWILQIVATSVISSIFSTIVTMNWFFKFTFFGWTLSFTVSGSWNEQQINMSRIIKLSRIRNNFDSTLVWNYRGEFARYTKSYFQTFYICVLPYFHFPWLTVCFCYKYRIMPGISTCRHIFFFESFHID